MKIKLFTHTDLDGVGCAILSKVAFGDDVDIQFSDYTDINTDVILFLASAVNEYDGVYITDISVDESVADLIEKLYRHKVTLIDHHGSAEWLNKYDWATVCETDDSGNVCGTSLFHDYLTFYDYYKTNDALDRLVETIRLYDTWDWKAKGDETPNSLNTFFRTIGRMKFLNRMAADQTFFTKEDSDILAVVEDMKARYIKTALWDVETRDLTLNGKQYKVGVIYAEQYISEIGNRACEEHEDIDFCIIIDMQHGAMSYRCTRGDIDLGKDIASLYGGGGHPKTAGSQIDSATLNQITDIILRRP